MLFLTNYKVTKETFPQNNQVNPTTKTGEIYFALMKFCIKPFKLIEDNFVHYNGATLSLFPIFKNLATKFLASLLKWRNVKTSHKLLEEVNI